MSDFNATYPEYAATARLDKLRATEYSYLDEGGHVYLDYTGAGLAAQSQLLAHTARLQAAATATRTRTIPRRARPRAW